MKVARVPHRWNLTPREAVVVQRRLAGRVLLCPAKSPARVVGLDCAFTQDRILAVAVVWDVADRRVLETRGLSQPVHFPYVPGLLSFREVPALLNLLRRLRVPVDAVLCDGQGVAHPRRLGLASHLGVIVGVPTVGVAKSRLIGTHGPLGRQRGATTPLMDGDERVGTLVRTRADVKPLYVSPGHLCAHADAVAWVLRCGAGYRLPEPTRLADRLVAQFKRQGSFRGGVVVHS